MLVTVKDNYLNIRTGLPSVNAPNTQFLNPGQTFEIDGNLYKGDLYQDISTWVKDAGGNYYWLGGVNLDVQNYFDSNYNGGQLKNPIDYFKLLEINENVKSGKGQGVTICILDHQISTSVKVQNDIIRPFHTGDPLLNFHANFITGIIAGISGVLGIASNVTIVELPIYNEFDVAIDTSAVFKYISDHNGPLLINISDSLDPELNDTIANIGSDKIFIASVGIDNVLSSNPVRSPGSSSNVLAVGAVNSPAISATSINSKVDFVLPNYNFTSYGKNTDVVIQERGDSFACAVVTAITALLISSGITQYDITSIKTALANIALPFSNQSSFHSFNPINPKT